MQHGRCGAHAQGELLTHRHCADVQPVPVAQVRVGSGIDSQVGEIVAAGMEGDVTPCAQLGPGRLAVGSYKAAGATLGDAAQPVAQAQVATGAQLADHQTAAVLAGYAFHADTDLVAGSHRAHLQTAPAHAQADVGAAGRCAYLGDRGLTAGRAHDLQEGPATAGAQGTDALCIHIDTAANKARTDVAALELRQLAQADHDVFLVEAFASGVVDEVAHFRDHAGMALVGRTADHQP